MKITINIEKEDAIAIKKFLEQIKRIKKPSKQDVTGLIQGIVDDSLTGENVMGDYINSFRNPYGPNE